MIESPHITVEGLDQYSGEKLLKADWSLNDHYKSSDIGHIDTLIPPHCRIYYVKKTHIDGNFFCFSRGHE